MEGFVVAEFVECARECQIRQMFAVQLRYTPCQISDGQEWSDLSLADKFFSRRLRKSVDVGQAESHNELAFVVTFNRTLPLRSRHVYRFDLQAVTFCILNQSRWMVKAH